MLFMRNYIQFLPEKQPANAQNVCGFLSPVSSSRLIVLLRCCPSWTTFWLLVFAPYNHVRVRHRRSEKRLLLFFCVSKWVGMSGVLWSARWIGARAQIPLFSEAINTYVIIARCRREARRIFSSASPRGGPASMDQAPRANMKEWKDAEWAPKFMNETIWGRPFRFYTDCSHKKIIQKLSKLQKNKNYLFFHFYEFNRQNKILKNIF